LAANEDQVRQAIEEMLNLKFPRGFRTYPSRARTDRNGSESEISPTRSPRPFLINSD
jgi:hypothetical protein